MNHDRIQQLRKVFLAIAENVSSMSFATRSKVGAVIVYDGNIRSVGWNGMPSGLPNEEIEYVNEDGSISTNPLTLHAESNAILYCARNGLKTEGTELYVTMSPCPDCAKLIIQSGIKTVFYRDQYRLTDGIDILNRKSIPTIQLKD